MLQQPHGTGMDRAIRRGSLSDKKNPENITEEISLHDIWVMKLDSWTECAFDERYFP